MGDFIRLGAQGLQLFFNVLQRSCLGEVDLVEEAIPPTHFPSSAARKSPVELLTARRYLPQQFKIDT